MSNRIFCFVSHFSFSLHQNKSIGFLTIFRFADLAKDTEKTQFKLSGAFNCFSCHVLVYVKYFLHCAFYTLANFSVPPAINKRI